MIKAPQWVIWRGTAKTARHAGLSPLVDAVEEGDVTGDEIASAFDFAYARWVAETIVNEDEVLSGKGRLAPGSSLSRYAHGWQVALGDVRLARALHVRQPNLLPGRDRSLGLALGLPTAMVFVVLRRL